MTTTKPSLARLKELEVRLYRLTTKSHLAIGAGEAAELSPVDKPIIRALIYNEEERVPYLPASSLHGVIRAWVEKALRSLNAPIANLKSKFDKFEQNHKDAAAWLQQKVCADLDLARDCSLDDMAQNWELWKEVCNPFWDHDKCEYLTDESETRPNPKRLWLEHLGRSVPCQACALFGHLATEDFLKTHLRRALLALPFFPFGGGRGKFTQVETEIVKEYSDKSDFCPPQPAARLGLLTPAILPPGAKSIGPIGGSSDFKLANFRLRRYTCWRTGLYWEATELKSYGGAAVQDHLTQARVGLVEDAVLHLNKEPKPDAIQELFLRGLGASDFTYLGWGQVYFQE